MAVKQLGPPEKTPLADFLAWRMDVEANQRAIAESNKVRHRTLQLTLSTCAELLMDEPPVEYGDRLETHYRLRWRDGGVDGDDRVWVYGPRSMSQTELEDYFKRQIEVQIAKRAAAQRRHILAQGASPG